VWESLLLSVLAFESLPLWCFTSMVLPSVVVDVGEVQLLDIASFFRQSWRAR
jgi:hypothetical protein